MTEVKKNKVEETRTDAKEFLELLAKLTEGDKREVKGLMMGLQKANMEGEQKLLEKFEDIKKAMLELMFP